MVDRHIRGALSGKGPRDERQEMYSTIPCGMHVYIHGRKRRRRDT